MTPITVSAISVVGSRRKRQSASRQRPALARRASRWRTVATVAVTASVAISGP